MLKKEALFYERHTQNRVRCNLCAHHCVIADGKLGVCRVRKNVGGTLYTLVHGSTISQNVDPVEKKPLYHFYPGSLAYSIATLGCNFHCQWCQNWQISQMPHEQDLIAGHKESPGQIVANALETGSIKWVLISAILPLAMGLSLTFLVAQIWRFVAGIG